MNSTTDEPFFAAISSYTSLVTVGLGILSGISFILYRLYKCYYNIKNNLPKPDIEEFLEVIKDGTSISK